MWITKPRGVVNENSKVDTGSPFRQRAAVPVAEEYAEIAKAKSQDVARSCVPFADLLVLRPLRWRLVGECFRRTVLRIVRRALIERATHSSLHAEVVV